MDQLAAGFVALGLKKGDRVGMWGPNMRAWILTQYATARAGLLQVMLLIDSFCYSGFYIHRWLKLWRYKCQLWYRVEKFKNLQNKACLPSLLCYLMRPGQFGGDFRIFCALGFCLERMITAKVPRTHQMASYGKAEKV